MIENLSPKLNTIVHYITAMFHCRKTKVFMKYYHLEQLSDVLKRMGFSAIKIQKGKPFS
jgi:hypothetical protein